MIDFVAQIKINMKMECQIIREYYVGMFSIICVPPQFADVILEWKAVTPMPITVTLYILKQTGKLFCDILCPCDEFSP